MVSGLTTCLLLLLLVLGIWHIRTAQRVLFFDGRLSDQTQNNIRPFLFSTKLKGAVLLKSAYEQCGAIEQIDRRLMGSAKMHLYVHAADPLYRVKDVVTHREYVLTRQKLVPRQHYVDYVVEYLPVIMVTGLKESEYELFNQTMTSLPEELLDQYSVTFKDKTDIRLQSKKQQFEIVADWQTIREGGKIAYAQKLAEKKYMKKWVTIDIRFAHAAVCTPKGR